MRGCLALLATNEKLHSIGSDLLFICFSNQPIENLPLQLRSALLSRPLPTDSPALRLALEFVAIRTERWARDIVLNALKNKSLDNKSKVALINALSKKPPPSQLQALGDIYSQSSDDVLVVASAGKLSENSAWFAENKQTIQAKITNAWAKQNHHLAIELGEVLFRQEPEATLSLFISDERGMTSE